MARDDGWSLPSRRRRSAGRSLNALLAITWHIGRAERLADADHRTLAAYIELLILRDAEKKPKKP
jgi:hypothetical protein